MNIPLLRKVQQAIADPYYSFQMTNWCYCIAGRTLAVVGRVKNNNIEKAARMELDLNEDQTLHLFHICDWPIQPPNDLDMEMEREYAIKNIEALIQDPENFEKGLPPRPITCNEEVKEEIGELVEV